MAKSIMIQGTMSSAGKSFLCAALARVFVQDGYRVAPFKSQNMALNSFVTKEGLEMGRAQVMQAEAAGIDPICAMNPILLKPTSDVGSQVIVNGEVLGNMRAREYFAYKKQLIPDILKAYHKLEEMSDIIVIEGAGSPAEINLKDNDIVNMGLAKIVDAPVLLAGDIDRGGVFAQLLGTVMLLPEDEQKRVKGLIINKFRGDKSILDPGIKMLEERAGIPVVATVPYMDVQVEDEDSLTERFAVKAHGQIDFAVIRYPHISNFTDFNVFEQFPEVGVRYVTNPRELGEPDVIFLPGSKNTIGDLIWLRETGMEAQILRVADRVPVFGICGGYQILGETVSDPEGVESEEMAVAADGSVKTVDGESLGVDAWSGARAKKAVREIRGMGLLPVDTALMGSKTRTQTGGQLGQIGGVFEALSGQHYEGYEIHMGKTTFTGGLPEGYNGAGPGAKAAGTGSPADAPDASKTAAAGTIPGIVTVSPNGMCAGSYIHGIFDTAEMAGALVRSVAKRRGIVLGQGSQMDYRTFKETQYNKMADIFRANVDMDLIYRIMGMK